MECAECEWNVYQGHAPDCSRFEPEPDAQSRADDLESIAQSDGIQATRMTDALHDAHVLIERAVREFAEDVADDTSVADLADTHDVAAAILDDLIEAGWRGPEPHVSEGPNEHVSR